MTTRPQNMVAAMLVALTVAVIPASTPMVVAYDANVKRPDDSVRVMLPDWNRLGDVAERVDSAIVRRAMADPQQNGGNETMGFFVAIGSAVCSIWFTGIGGLWCAAGAVGYVVWTAANSSNDPCLQKPTYYRDDHTGTLRRQTDPAKC